MKGAYTMPKLVLMYNLNEEYNEEEFFGWVQKFKGPFMLELKGVKSYTLTKIREAKQNDCGPFEPVESPYQVVGIVDITSFEEYEKNQQLKAWQEEFVAGMRKYSTNGMMFCVDEVFPEPD
jgi:hypothetical protein